MFFKRLSRSRSNSQSYVDSYDSRHDSKANSASYDDARAYVQDKYSTGGQQVQQSPIDGEGARGIDVSDQAPQLGDPLPKDSSSVGGMYPRQGQPTEVVGGGSGAYASPPMSAGGPRGNGGMTNGFGTGSREPMKHENAPDLLTQAFNAALRPYHDKVDTLEAEVNDLRTYIDRLEQQQSEVHAWIDKRGLRPDVPPSIAHQMDTASHTSSPTHAAQTLNAQLDRKITIVNFDLHRLQDDLNDSLPTPSFSACMLKFLPDISRLSALPSGPRYAFDLLLKLGGNLNSHGGLENGDEDDLAERRSFYGRLDEAMVEVVRGRFREEGESWGVQREIKRIEKTGAYLRNWGVEPYFPQTLEVMRGETGVGGSSSQQQQVAGGAQSPGEY